MSSSQKGIQFHYRKHKNTPDKVNTALLYDIQNYIPLYSRFFDLSDSNFNQLQLNQKYYIQNIIEAENTGSSTDNNSTEISNSYSTPNYLETTIVDDDGNSKNVSIFVKYSPLLDPIRYLSGKYDINDDKTHSLPKLNSNVDNCEPKMLDKNNASYTDGFFSYLTSQTLHKHNNVHGIDYYGSYLCKQREFSTNIYDDLDYLIECDFFNNQENKIYTLDLPLDELTDDDNNSGNKHDSSIVRLKLKRIIGTGTTPYDNEYDDIVEQIVCESIETVHCDTGNNDSNNSVSEIEILDIPYDDVPYISSVLSSSSDNVCDSGVDVITQATPVDTTNSSGDHFGSFHLKDKKRKGSNRIHDNSSDDNSNSYGSDDDDESSLSNSSNTTTSDTDCDTDDINDTSGNICKNIITDHNTVSNDSIEVKSETADRCDNNDEKSSDDDDHEGSEEDHEGSEEDREGSEGSEGESYNSDDEKVIAKIKNFPVQAILLEKCVSTLDNIMMNDELTSEEWVSILFQVIMTLVIYQHMFEFTHNDLHTNNVMFIETTEEFIYYLYKEQYYKVPTYGRIFKIIDFGRSIYKFRGELICSDSFNFKGDAATQYNFGPYYNPNKPVVEPNYSFDLCRFACALFDYFIHDIRKVEKICKSDPVVNLIVKWTFDDKGRNVLYKSSGEERYPDFKLYKMIARSVHNHIPSTQILDPLFDQYKITHKKYKKHASLSAKFLKDGKNTHICINVDQLPCYSEIDN
jgi:hypothetical protein